VNKEKALARVDKGIGPRPTGSTASADLGNSKIHKKTEPCPSWCHYCPHMRGHIFPQCYGSVCQHDDEDDLMHCTCNPSDPTVAQADLISRTMVLIRLLRDKRRERRIDRQAVVRILDICRAMRFCGDRGGMGRALGEIESLARRLSTAMEQPPSRDAVDPVVDSHPSGPRAS